MITLFVGACLLSLGEPPSMMWPLLAGAAGGMAFLIRPYTAVCVAAPTLLYVAVSAANSRGWRSAGRRLAAGAAPALVLAGLFLGYNALLTGHPIPSPFVRYDPADLSGNSSPPGGPSFRLQHLVIPKVVD